MLALWQSERAVVSANVPSQFFTKVTVHEFRRWLNAEASENISIMLVAELVCHELEAG